MINLAVIRLKDIMKFFKGIFIFLCIITILVYLCSKTVVSKNSSLSDKDKEKLYNMKNEMLNEKKGKK